MQGSRLAGQKEAPQAHNSIFLLVFARRSSNVAQLRWDVAAALSRFSRVGMVGHISDTCLSVPRRAVLVSGTTYAVSGPAPLFLFVCNYACSKQNPGALDNVTRPHRTPPHPTSRQHFLYLSISHFPVLVSHFPFPIGSASCSFQCCATWRMQMRLRWIRDNIKAIDKVGSKPFGHCQQFRLRRRLRLRIRLLLRFQLRRLCLHLHDACPVCRHAHVRCLPCTSLSLSLSLHLRQLSTILSWLLAAALTCQLISGPRSSNM